MFAKVENHYKEQMKVALIRLRKLGDIILSTALLQALKKTNPNLYLFLITKDNYSGLASMLPAQTKILCLTAPHKTKSIKELGTILSHIKLDIILDLQCNPSSLLLNVLAHPRRRYFYKKDIFHRHFRIRTLSKLKTKHTIKKYFYAAEKAWLLPRDSAIITPFLIPPSREKQVTQMNSPIVILPGAGRFTKRWILIYYVRLSQLLIAAGKTPIFIGGKSDTELLNSIQKIGAEGIFRSDLTLIEIAKTIHSADIILGNDSGLSQMAWALGKPLVLIAGGTHRILGFFPFGMNIKIIEENLPCRPCSLHGLSNCPKKHFKCMKLLTPEKVFSTLLAIWPPK